jgi:hypothetical protein
MPRISDDRDKAFREALAGDPGTIQSRVLHPKVSASDRLRWVALAVRVFRAPNSRPITRLDIENKRKVAKILKAAVPALERIRDKHPLAPLRKTAARYLRYIVVKVGSGESPSGAMAKSGWYLTARNPQAHQRAS